MVTFAVHKLSTGVRWSRAYYVHCTVALGDGLKTSVYNATSNRITLSREQKFFFLPGGTSAFTKCKKNFGFVSYLDVLSSAQKRHCGFVDTGILILTVAGLQPHGSLRCHHIQLLPPPVCSGGGPATAALWHEPPPTACPALHHPAAVTPQRSVGHLVCVYVHVYHCFEDTAGN